MGSIRKILHKADLPQRELHHSRMFIDLAENIHIHHREFRTVFSLDEYFEYADIIAKSTEDVRNYLEQNPDYLEGKYPTTIMIAGGKNRQLKFLEHSPLPNQSRYFANEFAIELQDVFVTDEVHIHYRDFRIALDRERFKAVAKGFQDSLTELENFEQTESYEREYHPDHVIEEYNAKAEVKCHTAKVMGVESVSTSTIRSRWFEDKNIKWKADLDSINAIKESIAEKIGIPPILLSTETNGEHFIVDGHHRFVACRELNLATIDAVILNLTFDQTENIRGAEALLKKFDIETNFEYSLCSFMKSYLANRLNRFYATSFRSKMKKQTFWWRGLRAIKRKLFGKRQIFKSFNEKHNHHN